MPSEARQKKIREKLNRAQKCSILGPQNQGSGGAPAPGAPPGSAPELDLLQNDASKILISHHCCIRDQHIVDSVRFFSV